MGTDMMKGEKSETLKGIEYAFGFNNNTDDKIGEKPNFGFKSMINNLVNDLSKEDKKIDNEQHITNNNPIFKTIINPQKIANNESILNKSVKINENEINTKKDLNLNTKINQIESQINKLREQRLGRSKETKSYEKFDIFHQNKPKLPHDFIFTSSESPKKKNIAKNEILKNSNFGITNAKSLRISLDLVS